MINEWMTKKMRYVVLITIFICFTITTFCSWQNKEVVVVYTSLDQIYSEPILREFEKKTGIKVKALYDTEAAKTVGLVNKIIAEKDNPQCDVFWNNEFLRTIMLKEKGILTRYRSTAASDIPEEFKDAEGYWTGFAARTRVIIYNTNLVDSAEAPQSIFDLLHPKWMGEICIAKPLFGTTSTHVAALYLVFGKTRAREYLLKLKANKVRVFDGNAVVKNMVADGEVKIGLTDSDDANIGLEQNKSIAIVFPDQDSFGTFFIPNTVCLIKNCPHPETGKKLIDYLLSPEVEEKLSKSLSKQIPLRSDIELPDIIPENLKYMKIDYEECAAIIEMTAKEVKEIFLK
jgi:iron(III) transport system substrate-binding protein